MNAVLLVLKQSGLLLTDLLPFVLAGSVAGALLKKAAPVISGGKLTRLPETAAVPVCALLGALSPICTLGSVPIMAGLVQCGLPFSAGLAFLVASSMITPQIAVLNFGMLGSSIALIQIGGGLMIAITAGFLFRILEKRNKWVSTEIGQMKSYDGSSDKKFGRILLEQLSFILPMLLIGILLSQLLQLIISGQKFSAVNGKPGIAVLLGTLLSGPLYICGGAVLPLLDGLRNKGLSEGAITAFLICGPATRFRSFAAYARFLRPSAVALLTAVIVVMSLLTGFLSNLIL